MNPLERIHGGYVHPRRVHVLSTHLAELLPRNARVLDVGCGDGLLAHQVVRRRPDVRITGVDVIVRDRTYLSVERFDGRAIPYRDVSYDVVMCVDVLHHAEDPLALLREAVRVAGTAVVVKDHLCDGFFARSMLRLMDWVGNARHGVARPGRYWSQQQWVQAFATLGVAVSVWKRALYLYPWPARWIFDRSLHFLARLDVGEANRRPTKPQFRRPVPQFSAE